MHKNAPLLSSRERKIIALLAEGHTPAKIGSLLKISAPDVQQLIQQILHKQGFENSYQLISWAYREAILS
jgi:DNA-binding CsgD family transcriptional regulator